MVHLFADWLHWNLEKHLIIYADIRLGDKMMNAILLPLMASEDRLELKKSFEKNLLRRYSLREL